MLTDLMDRKVVTGCHLVKPQGPVERDMDEDAGVEKHPRIFHNSQEGERAVTDEDTGVEKR